MNNGQSSTNSAAPGGSVVPDVLQWNCNGLLGRKNELTLRLQTLSIPILALSEGALPDKQTLPGYMKYVCPRLSTFPHGSAALYVSCATPHCQLDTSGFPQGEYECVAVRVKLRESVFTVASVYVSCRERNAGDIFQSLLSVSLTMTS